MVNLMVGTTSERHTLMIDQETPIEVFNSVGISYQQTLITLNGMQLGLTDVNTPIVDILPEGTTEAALLSIIKGDSA